MIYKKKHERDYTIIDNSLLRDKRLSLQARGLMSYLLSNKETWQISFQKIQQETGVKRGQLESIIKELQALNYLKVERTTIKGKYKVIYTVYEEPYVEKSFLEQLRECEEPSPF
jgi:hypothetical protein